MYGGESKCSVVPATVSVTVSLGARPAQAEGECLIVQRLDTVALWCTCFPCLHTCQTHLTFLPTHSRSLKVCQKKSCICHTCICFSLGLGSQGTFFFDSQVCPPDRSFLTSSARRHGCCNVVEKQFDCSSTHLSSHVARSGRSSAHSSALSALVRA